MYKIFIKATATKVIGIKDPFIFNGIILFLFAVPSSFTFSRSLLLNADGRKYVSISLYQVY